MQYILSQTCPGSDLVLLLSTFNPNQYSLHTSVRVPVPVPVPNPVPSSVSDNTEMSVRCTLQTLYDLFSENEILISNYITNKKYKYNTIDNNIVNVKNNVQNKNCDRNNTNENPSHRTREASEGFVSTPFHAVIDFVHMAGNNGVSNISGIDGPSSRERDYNDNNNNDDNNDNNNDNENSNNDNDDNENNMTVEKLITMSVNRNIIRILSSHPFYSSSSSSADLQAHISNVDVKPSLTSISPYSSTHPPPPFISSSPSSSPQAHTSKLPFINLISPIWIMKSLKGRYELIGSETSYPALNSDEIYVRSKLQEFFLQNSNKV